MIRSLGRLGAAFLLLSILLPPASAAPLEAGKLTLDIKTLPGTSERVFAGNYTVHENRETREGRVIALELVILPARKRNPEPDPVFFLAGGPGQGATGAARGYLNSWIRDERDIVFVDQRGTGKSNPLPCALWGPDDDLQSSLDELFPLHRVRACRKILEERADLRHYGTSVAMDDLDEIRAALGYERINLTGGSYGTRASLVYMRRHPEHVRTAVLNGVAPISFVNPLYHAWSAQLALDRMFAICEEDPRYRKAFPDLRKKLEEILARLESPAQVTIPHPRTGAPTTLELSRNSFCEALRVMMYYGGTASSVPFHLMRAHEGELGPFVTLAVRSNRAIRNQLAFGMLLSVTCTGDIPRIDPERIPELTDNTFLGDVRVRAQMAACELWPRGDAPEGFGDPVRCDAPTLLLSGSLDPVTPPEFAEEAASHLPNSLHVVVPGYHGVAGSSCVQEMIRTLLEEGTVDGIDTGCVGELRLSPFRTR